MLLKHVLSTGFGGASILTPDIKFLLFWLTSVKDGLLFDTLQLSMPMNKDAIRKLLFILKNILSSQV
jgi:hypothetical protein